MESEFLNIVLMPFDFFLDLIGLNLYNFTDAFVLLIILNAVYRYLLAPILGYQLGHVGSDYVAKKNYERNQRFRNGG